MATQSHTFTPRGTEAYRAPELNNIADKRDKGLDPRANLFKTDNYSAALVILFCSGIPEIEISKGIDSFVKSKHQDDIESYIEEKINPSYPGLDHLVRRMSAFSPADRADIGEALEILSGIRKLYPPNPNLNPNQVSNPLRDPLCLIFTI